MISGSLGGGTSPAVIGEIIGHCKSLGAVTVVDTSGKALRHACDAKPNAVKPNLSELMELCGEDLSSLSDITSAALMLVESGINTVVVSLGEKGLLYVTKTAYSLPRSLRQRKMHRGSGRCGDGGIGIRDQPGHGGH